MESKHRGNRSLTRDATWDGCQAPRRDSLLFVVLPEFFNFVRGICPAPKRRSFRTWHICSNKIEETYESSEHTRRTQERHVQVLSLSESLSPLRSVAEHGPITVKGFLEAGVVRDP